MKFLSAEQGNTKFITLFGIIFGLLPLIIQIYFFAYFVKLIKIKTDAKR